MFEERPSPIIANAQAADKLPRLALLFILAIFILPGIFSREFWGSTEVASFSVVLSMLNGSGIDWALPNCQGAAQYSLAPLSLWVASTFATLLGPLMGHEVAARLSILFWFTLTTSAIWYGTWYLARRAEAQPVALAFGQSANPKDYARVVADGALLLFVATFGLLIPLRELTPSIAMIAISAGFTFSLIWSLAHPKKASIASGILSACAVFAFDLWLGLAILAISIMAQWRIHAIQEPFAPRALATLIAATATFFIWPIAGIATSLETIDAWFAGWFHYQLSLVSWPNWSDTKWLLTNFIWFLWPIWPFALVCLRCYRKQLRRSHIQLPLWVLSSIVLWALFVDSPRESAFMALLPPLTILASFGVMASSRGWSAMLDWFSATVFSLAIMAVWAYYFAWLGHFPPKMYASVARLAPYLQPHFHGLWFAVAFAATLAWIAAILWRTNRLRHAAWKGPWLAAAGMAALACITINLFDPVIDANRSYRTVAEAINDDVDQGTLINASQLTPFEFTFMSYYGLALTRQESPYTLIRVHSDQLVAPLPYPQESLVDIYSRPGDKNQFMLLKQ